jgi:RNA polymerase sigma-70 factor, ECF subfamily
LARANHPENELSDEDLLTRLRDGERDLFGAVVRRFQNEIFLYLLRYTGDRQNAEDSFQNTFLQVYLKIGQYEPGRPVRPWLYRIATNQAIDLMRSQGRHHSARIDLPSEETAEGGGGTLLDCLSSAEREPYERLLLDEKRQQVQQAIMELPPAMRDVVLLVFYAELKYADIAEILGVPVGTIKSRLHNALIRLSRIWQAKETASEEAASVEESLSA